VTRSPVRLSLQGRPPWLPLVLRGSAPCEGRSERRKRHSSSPQRRGERGERRRSVNGETAQQFTAETQRTQRKAKIGERRNGTAVHRRDAENAENGEDRGTAKRHSSSPQRSQRTQRKARTGERRPSFVPENRDFGGRAANGTAFNAENAGGNWGRIRMRNALREPPFDTLRALSRSTTLTALSPSKGMVEGRNERQRQLATACRGE
jgi:hypothetical protein